MRGAPGSPQRLAPLRHAGCILARTLAALGAVALGLGSLAAGNLPGATIGLLLGVAFGLAAARAGGRTQAAVAQARARRTSARQLRSLAERGWHIQHGLRWPGGGCLNHFAVTPERELSFSITAAASWPGPAARNEIGARAGWLALSGPPCVPVCVLSGEVQDALEDGVLIVGADGLARALGEARRGYRNGGGTQRAGRSKAEGVASS